MTPRSPRTPVEAAILDQLVYLGLPLKDLVVAAKVSAETLRKIRLQGTVGVDPKNVAKVEDALHWQRGSIADIESGGQATRKALLPVAAHGQPSGTSVRPHAKETITIEERRDGSGLVDYIGRRTIVGSGPDRIDKEIIHIVKKSDLTADMDDWILDHIQNAFRKWSAENS